MDNRDNNQKMTKPLVSVLLPVYNGEKYIIEAVKSTLNQDYENFELIVINDASTDATLSILESIAVTDSRLRIITILKQNSLGDVLNIGISNASGKYIARMDADDVILPGRLTSQVQFLESNPEYVVVGGQIELIDNNGNTTGTRSYPTTDEKLRRNFFLFQPFAHPATMMRAEALKNAGGYPEGLRKVEDIILMFKLSKLGKIGNLPTRVLQYRISYDTQSQANFVEHFWNTNNARKWVVDNLGIKPSMRELFVWNLQKVIVATLSHLPSGLFLRVFEIGRSILNK